MPHVHVVVVVPCYNEERRLRAEAFRGFRLEGHRVEFCFVDDGSRDGTRRMLESLAGEDAGRFRVLPLDRNSGKAEAVRRGMVDAAARNADLIGYWDADLATPLSELPFFIDKLAAEPEIEMVYGARVRLMGRDITRQATRHYVGRVGATLISQTLGLAVYDTQCGAKLFRNTTVVREIFARPFVSRWIFDVEIIARHIAARGHDAAKRAIYELPLSAWHDVPGSKVSPLDFVRSLADLWKIRRTYPL